MITWIYRAIVLLVLIFVSKEFWEETTISAKICACMVMLPLTLRVLMIK